MIGHQFYPTPKNVIRKILAEIQIQDQCFLEPSAGKGDIVDYLKENGAKQVLACEIDKNLRAILSEKADRIMCKDFLELESHEISHVDCIVMNPPFENADKHILHAFEIAPDGCQIVAICNSETLNNPYTKTRKELLEKIEDNSFAKWDYFGNCFHDAERQTDVSVVCMYLKKPGESKKDEFEDYFCMDEEIQEQQAGLTKYHYVRDLVGRYVDAVKMFDDVMEASNKINSITKPISSYCIQFGARRSDNRGNFSHDKITREEFKKDLQKKAWDRIFQDMKMERFVTQSVKGTINKFIEQQEKVPFTMTNIYKMIDIIVGTHSERMNTVLVEAFDLICSFSSENSTAGEKWRTNSDYMINKKFIVPGMVTQKSWISGVSASDWGAPKIEDIVKALCNLTGENYDNHQPLSNFARNTENIPYDSREKQTYMDFGVWYDWGFFEIKGFKKGTMHFKFKDEKVWEMFNQRVSEIKGWRLPKKSATTKKEKWSRFPEKTCA